MYLHWNNHAKLLITDEAAYVGSANFSARSRKKIECGIVAMEPLVATRVYREVFCPIQDVSRPLASGSVERFRGLLSTAWRAASESLESKTPDEYDARQLTTCLERIGHLRAPHITDVALWRFVQSIPDALLQEAARLGAGFRSIAPRIASHDGRSGAERMSDTDSHIPSRATTLNVALARGKEWWHDGVGREADDEHLRACAG